MPEKGTSMFAVAASEQLAAPFTIDFLPPQFGPVTSVAADGVAALVSSYAGPSLRELSKEELLRRLLAHQRVNEVAMARGTVLPVRLGTLVASHDHVQTLLATWAPTLSDAWTSFKGLVEIDIAATWNTEEALAQVAQLPSIEAAKRQALAAPPEERHTEAVDVGHKVGQALDDLRSSYRRRLVAEIEPYARDVMVHGIVVDEMVCNVAFLIEADALCDCDGALERVDRELDGRFNFRRIGPLPPYSFATVHVRELDAGYLAEARGLLGLETDVSEEAVKKGFRRLVAAAHPDVNQGDPPAELRVDALKAARDDLLAHLKVPQNGAGEVSTGDDLTYVVTIAHGAGEEPRQ